MAEVDSTAADARSAEALLEALIARYAFGPAFFLGQLAAFVRDRCPLPDQRLPRVELHLQGGEVLEVCHVIGVSPRWVALAVRSGDRDAMANTFVPYELIVRVDIRAADEGRRVGFSQRSEPALFHENGTSAEELLRAASGR